MAVTLDQIIGTYNDAEIIECIERLGRQIDDIYADLKQYELALALHNRYRLSDELEKRIVDTQALGLRFTGFDETGNEVWVTKTSYK